MYVEAVNPTLNADMLLAKKIGGRLESDESVKAGGSDFKKGRK